MVGDGPDRKGLTARYALEGQPSIALNGGPHFTFTEAVAVLVACADQAEVDALWTKLLDGGEPSRCGWLMDRVGLSWRIVPAALFDLINDAAPARSRRVVDAVTGAVRLDLAAPKRAHAG